MEEAKRGAGVQTNRKECRRGYEQGAEEARGHRLQAWVKSYLEEGGEPLHRPGKEGKEGNKHKDGLVISKTEEFPFDGRYFFCQTGDEVIHRDGRRGP